MRIIRAFKVVLFIRLLIETVTPASAQNLVPNPSFEIYDTCPMYVGELYRCSSWVSPTSNTPDYFNACWNESWWNSPDVPINVVGSQPARTGEAYAGFAALYSTVNGREYISVQLMDTLEADKQYCIEFYVSLADSFWGGVNFIGAHLSVTPDTMYYGFYPFNLPFAPQIEYDSVIKDTTTWVKINGSFIAVGGETYMTIGVFKPDSLLTYDSIQGDGSGRGTYYFIDDVAVWQCDTPATVYPSFTLYPNPSNGAFNISGNFPAATQLSIYNMLGQKIGESIILPEGNRIISVDLELAQGTYYYVLRTPAERVAEGKFIIIE